MILPSIKEFIEDYETIYKQAEEIFCKYNLCQWNKNIDGTFSCIVNRQNSHNSNSQLIEIDGCCIIICKNPKDFNDKIINRKQHNAKNGCKIKSLKCKLHICKYLRNSNCLDTIEAIKQIDLLRNMFRLKYDVIWEGISYGSSKKICIEFYKTYKNIFK